jgi:SAM-dependent methyltransferase
VPFADAAFDVIVSNLRLHNIYDAETRRRALGQIVRVLRPGGQALISDYKLTSGSLLTTLSAVDGRGGPKADGVDSGVKPRCWFLRPSAASN